jgi:hypothetical protein
MANVDKILENISSRRESKKIDIDDLWGDDVSQDSPKSNWKEDAPDLSILEVLMMEKYVSGNPLINYKDLESWARETCGYDDIYIILVEKIRKIFTKVGNKLMLSVDTTSTLDIPLDGVVYSSKNKAIDLSPILAEKQIFWVKGKVEEPKSKKKELVADVDEEASVEEVKEFVENTKFIFDWAVPFGDGILGLLDKCELPLSSQRRETLEKVDWVSLQKNPNQMATKKIVEKSIITLKLRENTSISLVKELKSKLLKSQPTNVNDFVEIKLEIEHNGEYKKVVNTLWLDQKYYESIKDLI